MEAKTNKISTLINSKPFVIAKKVLWGIVYGLFALLAALVIWLAIDKFILKSPVPSIFGYATLTIETGSMESELQIGDLILIKKTGEYKIGDIITYAHPGDKIPTTHRIIGYTDGGFVTKGDNNNVKDTYDVPLDIVYGEIIKVYPKAGLFSKWVQQEGWIYIVAVLAIIALGGLVLKSDDDDKTEEKPEETTNEETTNEENNLEENSSEENI